MTAKIKLNAASGGGSFSLQAPSSSSNNRVITLPDIADGTLLTSQSSISGTITMADSWIVTSSYDTTGTNTIDSNWSRTTSNISGTGVIGSAMTESSGVFSFPSTGIYLVSIQIYFLTAGARTYAGVLHDLSTDSGSSFQNKLSAYGNGYTTSAYITHQSFQVYDITNTSTDRIRFRTEVSGLTSVQGNSAQKRTGAMFIRLGDT
jgi:hypothetical protein